MKIKYNTLPKSIIDKYNLQSLVHNGYIYLEIHKRMYGLKQAGVLANLNLEKLLRQNGYVKTTHTPGLWKYTTQPIAFILYVDDFGVKYIGKQHADHLIATLNKHYKAITVDWEGKKFCGMNLNWNCKHHTCDISMKDYVTRALTEFDQWKPTRKCNEPLSYVPPQYGQFSMLPPQKRITFYPQKKLRNSNVLLAVFFSTAASPTTQ